MSLASQRAQPFDNRARFAADHTLNSRRMQMVLSIVA